ncbi:MAG: transposase [Roseiarcus sp.]|jgi:transposase
MPVSNDTLLRAVRRRGSPSFAPPAIIGIDDWAWRRNHPHGTLICDLERRRTIALLPDREPATAEAWLTGPPQIAVAARDRGDGHALATQTALPNAVQVASGFRGNFHRDGRSTGNPSQFRRSPVAPPALLRQSQPATPAQSG